MYLFIVLFGLLVLLVPAWARPNGKWACNSRAICEWYQQLMQPDTKTVSCCGEADAFEADSFDIVNGQYIAVITDGKGVIANGTRIVVPPHKFNYHDRNPTGHGIIFLNTEGAVLCYVQPTGV